MHILTTKHLLMWSITVGLLAFVIGTTHATAEPADDTEQTHENVHQLKQRSEAFRRQAQQLKQSTARALALAQLRCYQRFWANWCIGQQQAQRLQTSQQQRALRKEAGRLEQQRRQLQHALRQAQAEAHTRLLKNQARVRQIAAKQRFQLAQTRAQEAEVRRLRNRALNLKQSVTKRTKQSPAIPAASAKTPKVKITEAQLQARKAAQSKRAMKSKELTQLRDDNEKDRQAVIEDLRTQADAARQTEDDAAGRNNATQRLIREIIGLDDSLPSQ